LRLNAPKKNVFYVAVALIVVGVAVFYLVDTPHYGFWTSTVGGLLLAAGSYFKGF